MEKIFATALLLLVLLLVLLLLAPPVGIGLVLLLLGWSALLAPLYFHVNLSLSQALKGLLESVQMLCQHTGRLTAFRVEHHLKGAVAILGQANGQRT